MLSVFPESFAITTDNFKLQISDLRKFPFKSKLISPGCGILNTIKCKDLKTMRNDYPRMFSRGVFVTLVFWKIIFAYLYFEK